MDLVQTIVLWAVPVVFAITLHEAAHGYVARMFGDQTAWMLGRVTLNPIKHIDPIGSIAVPGILIALSSPFVIGWAKPVPVNFANLRNPKRDMLWVALAGPAMNFAMAIAWAFFLLVTSGGGLMTSMGLNAMARIGIEINIMLMVLNLLPILPLDGGRILVSVLPMEMARAYSRMEPYGFFIVIALLATGALGYVLGPLRDVVLRAIFWVIGLV